MVSVEIMYRPDFRRRQQAALFLCVKGWCDEKSRGFCNQELAAAGSGICHYCGGGFRLHPFVFLVWMEGNGAGKRIVAGF